MGKGMPLYPLPSPRPQACDCSLSPSSPAMQNRKQGKVFLTETKLAKVARVA